MVDTDHGPGSAGSVPGPWAGLPLVVSSYTLGAEVSFVGRVEAAAAAGFDGIGLRAENYWAAQADGLSGVDLADIAATHGTPVAEVEYLTGWGTAATRDEAQQTKERTVFEMARTFGVRHVNAGLLEALPVDVIVRAFGDLCDRAGDDLTVALEFMPYSGVPDLATAWAVLEGAGRANSALLLDLWHWARAGTAASDLVPIPADRVVSVQLCDVLAQPMTPLRAESLGHRLPPGAGHGDTAGFVRTLQAHGVRPALLAVEVISDELIGNGVEIAARVSADAARRVLGDAFTR